MRNLNAGLADLQFVEKKNVQIEGPWSICNLCRSVAPELLLNLKQRIEQLPRLELRQECYDRIHKSRLLVKSHRRS